MGTIAWGMEHGAWGKGRDSQAYRIQHTAYRKVQGVQRTEDRKQKVEYKKTENGKTINGILRLTIKRLPPIHQNKKHRTCFIVFFVKNIMLFL